MMLGYTRSVIAGGDAPGTSPGRERLALAGVGAAGMAGLVHGLLKRRIEEAGECAPLRRYHTPTLDSNAVAVQSPSLLGTQSRFGDELLEI